MKNDFRKEYIDDLKKSKQIIKGAMLEHINNVSHEFEVERKLEDLFENYTGEKQSFIGYIHTWTSFKDMETYIYVYKLKKTFIIKDSDNFEVILGKILFELLDMNK